MGYATSTWRGVGPASLLVGVIVVLVVSDMALQKILAGECFAAYLTGETLAESVSLDVSGEMLGARIPSLAMGTLIKAGCRGVALVGRGGSGIRRLLLVLLGGRSRGRRDRL